MNTIERIFFFFVSVAPIHRTNAEKVFLQGFYWDLVQIGWLWYCDHSDIQVISPVLVTNVKSNC